MLLSHVYCCHPDRGLCTTNIANQPDTWDDLPLCIVCDDLTQTGTPCGPGCRFATHPTSQEQQP